LKNYSLIVPVVEDDTKAVLYKCAAASEMGDSLAIIDMGWKVGGCCALLGGTGEGRKLKQMQGKSIDME